MVNKFWDKRALLYTRCFVKSLMTCRYQPRLVLFLFLYGTMPGLAANIL